MKRSRKMLSKVFENDERNEDGRKIIKAGKSTALPSSSNSKKINILDSVTITKGRTEVSSPITTNEMSSPCSENKYSMFKN